MIVIRACVLASLSRYFSAVAERRIPLAVSRNGAAGYLPSRSETPVIARNTSSREGERQRESAREREVKRMRKRKEDLGSR